VPQYNLNLIWDIHTDGQFGLTANVGLQHYNLKNSEVNQTAFNEEIGSRKFNSKSLMSYELEAYYKFDSEATRKLFFRGRYLHNFKNGAANFLQLQFGYAFNVFKHDHQ
jgi:hypothetical protein